MTLCFMKWYKEGEKTLNFFYKWKRDTVNEKNIKSQTHRWINLKFRQRNTKRMCKFLCRTLFFKKKKKENILQKKLKELRKEFSQ